MTRSITFIPAITRHMAEFLLRLAAAFGVAGDRAGMRGAFTEAVRTHDAMIKRICLGYAQTAEDLDDIYQDVLVNIWQGLPRYRADASMKTWIYRIALNTCVSTLRSRSRKAKEYSLEYVVGIADSGEDRSGEIRELHECIATLGPVDKAIVMLWLDEYSYDEIAEMTGLKRNSVATRLHRAKEKLKKIYENGR